MRKILILGLIAAGGWYAYKRGLLPANIVDGAAELVPDAVWNLLPESMWGGAREDMADESEEIKAALDGQVAPILGDDEVVTVNKYEAVFRENWALVQPWARSNLAWAAAVMKTENGMLNPTISGDNGTSHGLMQVKTETAETCARAGYDELLPTKGVLLTERGAVYFGTAELDRLSKIPGKGSDREWVIKAYNGGAGWEQMDAAYRKGREDYLMKVRKNFAALYGAGRLV